jgi:hypothetical protein
MNRKVYLLGLSAFFISLAMGMSIHYLSISSSLVLFGGLLLGIALSYQAFSGGSMARFWIAAACMLVMAFTLYASPVEWIGYAFWVVYAVAPPVMIYLMSGDDCRKGPLAAGLLVFTAANLMAVFYLLGSSLCDPTTGSNIFMQIYLAYAISLSLVSIGIVKGKAAAAVCVIIVAITAFAAMIFVTGQICASNESVVPFGVTSAECGRDGAFNVTVTNTGRTVITSSDWLITVAENSTDKIKLEPKGIAPMGSAVMKSAAGRGSKGSYEIVVGTVDGVSRRTVKCP